MTLNEDFITLADRIRDSAIHDSNCPSDTRSFLDVVFIASKGILRPFFGTARVKNLLSGQ